MGNEKRGGSEYGGEKRGGGNENCDGKENWGSSLGVLVLLMEKGRGWWEGADWFSHILV